MVQQLKTNVINSIETRFVGFYLVKLPYIKLKVKSCFKLGLNVLYFIFIGEMYILSYLIFRCGDRLRKSKEGQGKIYKTVLEGLQFLISLNNLKYPQMKSA